jgi:hypothetical protein
MCISLPYHLHVPIALKPGSLNLLEPSGLSRPLMELLYRLPDVPFVVVLKTSYFRYSSAFLYNKTKYAVEVFLLCVQVGLHSVV